MPLALRHESVDHHDHDGLDGVGDDPGNLDSSWCACHVANFERALPICACAQLEQEVEAFSSYVTAGEISVRCRYWLWSLHALP